MVEVTDEMRAVARQAYKDGNRLWADFEHRIETGGDTSDMPDDPADIVLEAVAPLIEAAVLKEAETIAEKCRDRLRAAGHDMPAQGAQAVVNDFRALKGGDRG